MYESMVWSLSTTVLGGLSVGVGIARGPSAFAVFLVIIGIILLTMGLRWGYYISHPDRLPEHLKR